MRAARDPLRRACAARARGFAFKGEPPDRWGKWEPPRFEGPKWEAPVWKPPNFEPANLGGKWEPSRFEGPNWEPPMWKPTQDPEEGVRNDLFIYV